VAPEWLSRPLPTRHRNLREPLAFRVQFRYPNATHCDLPRVPPGFTQGMDLAGRQTVTYRTTETMVDVIPAVALLLVGTVVFVGVTQFALTSSPAINILFSRVFCGCWI
jgi:hypothetical protein